MAFQHGVTNLASAKQKLIPEDTRSPVLDFNMNRCIACAECINVCKDVLMIDALQFMKKGGFNQVVAKGDLALNCEFCGDCLAVCPVGAITNKFSKYLYKPWQMKRRRTCNYCVRLPTPSGNERLSHPGNLPFPGKTNGACEKPLRTWRTLRAGTVRV